MDVGISWRLHRSIISKLYGLTAPDSYIHHPVSIITPSDSYIRTLPGKHHNSTDPVGRKWKEMGAVVTPCHGHSFPRGRKNPRGHSDRTYSTPHSSCVPVFFYHGPLHSSSLTSQGSSPYLNSIVSFFSLLRNIAAKLAYNIGTVS